MPIWVCIQLMLCDVLLKTLIATSKIKSKIRYQLKKLTKIVAIYKLLIIKVLDLAMAKLSVVQLFAKL